MKLFLIAALLVLCASNLEGKPTRNEEWKAYLVRYNKSYNAATEAFRRSIWEAKKNMIDKHNAEADQGLQSYYMVDNQFADMTTEEYAAYVGTINPIQSDEDVPIYTGPATEEERLALPTTVDHRNDACMPTPKDQAQCGSCWSFSATNPVEYQHCKKHGSLVLLSEQQLVDCSTAYGNQGCNGGWFTAAWQYLHAAGGQEASRTYPYTARDGRCAFSAASVVAKVSSFTKVQAMNENALASAIATVGPVSVNIEATNSFSAYSHGVFNDPHCPHDGYTINHAVVAVGYGHDTTTGMDYWVVRNSWGPSWGESGYVRMKRGVNMCNIASGPGYPTVA